MRNLLIFFASLVFYSVNADVLDKNNDNTEQLSSQQQLNKEAAEKEAAEKLFLKKEEYRRKWKWIEAQAQKKSKPLDANKKKITLSWGVKVHRKIKKTLNYQNLKNNWKVVIKITISLDGYIDEEIIVKSCIGAPDFCKSIINAVKQAEPYPLPPKSLNKLDRTITFRFD